MEAGLPPARAPVGQAHRLIVTSEVPEVTVSDTIAAEPCGTGSEAPLAEGEAVDMQLVGAGVPSTPGQASSGTFSSRAPPMQSGNRRESPERAGTSGWLQKSSFPG